MDPRTRSTVGSSNCVGFFERETRLLKLRSLVTRGTWAINSNSKFWHSKLSVGCKIAKKYKLAKKVLGSVPCLDGNPVRRGQMVLYLDVLEKLPAEKVPQIVLTEITPHNHWLSTYLYSISFLFPPLWCALHSQPKSRIFSARKIFTRKKGDW